jgi:hypothetical protein
MGKRFIEKRRQGPVNRLRRTLYGLLLGSVTVPALAGSLQDAAMNGGTQQRLPRVQASGAQWMHDNVLLARDPGGSGVYAYAGLGPALSSTSVPGRDFAYLPVGDALFTAHFLGDDLSKIGKGLGVDLALPEFGYFHLNLYPGRNDMNGGKRLRIDPQGFDLPASGRAWSLGGSLALERDAPGEHRQLRFVPQLVLNLDTLTHVSGRMQAVISYHNWRSQVDRGPSDDQGPVPQITLKWWY